MSVNFNLRRVNDALLAALRQDSSLTGPLCNLVLDFVPPLETTEIRKQRMLDERAELVLQLHNAGLRDEDFGKALHLGRAWWSLAQMIGSPATDSVSLEAEGEAIGDDVGYGPARLLARQDVESIAAVLDAVTRNEAEARFREFESAELARQPRLVVRCSDDEFTKWSWEPFCELRRFVRETADENATILKWFD